MSQLFFSLSVSMGIMITYGSYVKKDVNLSKSLSQIEIFDTTVAFLAGLMIICGLCIFGTEGMASGPSLMFVSLPKVFEAMGPLGGVLGMIFSLWLCLRLLPPLYPFWKHWLQTVWRFSTPHEKKPAL